LKNFVHVVVEFSEGFTAWAFVWLSPFWLLESILNKIFELIAIKNAIAVLIEAFTDLLSCPLPSSLFADVFWPHLLEFPAVYVTTEILVYFIEHTHCSGVSFELDSIEWPVLVEFVHPAISFLLFKIYCRAEGESG